MLQGFPALFLNIHAKCVSPCFSISQKLKWEPEQTKIIHIYHLSHDFSHICATSEQHTITPAFVKVENT